MKLAQKLGTTLEGLKVEGFFQEKDKAKVKAILDSLVEIEYKLESASSAYSKIDPKGGKELEKIYDDLSGFNMHVGISLDNEMEEAAKKQASDSDKSKYQDLNKKIDALDAKKAKLLDQLSKEADDDKRSKVQDELHASREEIQKLNDQRKAMLNKFQGLRSK